jgi:hypothetical protein
VRVSITGAAKKLRVFDEMEMGYGNIGDDKKLRALYSAARVADKLRRQLHFGVASGAGAFIEAAPRFNLSFALVTALLVLTLGSLAVWSMYSPRTTSGRQVRMNRRLAILSRPP